MKFQTLTLAAIVATMVSCGQAESTEGTESTTPAMEESTPSSDEAVKLEDNLAVPEGAHVFFANIENGAVLSSPVNVQMGVEGMEVHAAGELISGTGHHHIIINKGHISKGETIPADEQHIHYGGGQTETDLDLEPGNYTLTLQFANGLHQSYGEQMSATVEITVE